MAIFTVSEFCELERPANICLCSFYSEIDLCRNCFQTDKQRQKVRHSELIDLFFSYYFIGTHPFSALTLLDCVVR